MGFSDRLHINKVITKEPEDTEEWLQRFIEIMLKEDSKGKSKDRHYQKKEIEALGKKEGETNNGTT